jgi:hypothetical protein
MSPSNRCCRYSAEHLHCTSSYRSLSSMDSHTRVLARAGLANLISSRRPSKYRLFRPCLTRIVRRDGPRESPIYIEEPTLATAYVSRFRHQLVGLAGATQFALGCATCLFVRCRPFSTRRLGRSSTHWNRPVRGYVVCEADEKQIRSELRVASKITVQTES